jgi:hypothetical protein
MAKLRDYYDNTSLTSEIAEAKLNTETVDSPMIGITVRFSKPVLDRVRDIAARENVKTTALVRRWVEEKLAATERHGGVTAQGTVIIFGAQGASSSAAIAAAAIAADFSRRAPLRAYS